MKLQTINKHKKKSYFLNVLIVWIMDVFVANICIPHYKEAYATLTFQNNLKLHNVYNRYWLYYNNYHHTIYTDYHYFKLEVTSRR